MGPIKERKLTICPSMADRTTDQCIERCPMCGDFLLWCCVCNQNYPEESKEIPCHHYRIVFTDGACMNNGNPLARAGVGVAYGDAADSQLSVPITDAEEPFQLRSNQRAELCAAKLGIAVVAEHYGKFLGPSGNTKDQPRGLIVATDSEYVVKGMTEWFPKWKKNKWCTAKGTRPANLDLFFALDREIQKCEAENIEIRRRMIGFWWVPRKSNGLADSLAKAAALKGDLAHTPKYEEQSETFDVGSMKAAVEQIHKILEQRQNIRQRALDSGHLADYM